VTGASPRAEEASSEKYESARYLLSSNADFERLREYVISGRIDGLLTTRPLGQIEELVPTVHANVESEGHTVHIDYDSQHLQATEACCAPAGGMSPSCTTTAFGSLFRRWRDTGGPWTDTTDSPPRVACLPKANQSSPEPSPCASC
jgi:hypothetical protein